MGFTAQDCRETFGGLVVHMRLPGEPDPGPPVPKEQVEMELLVKVCYHFLGAVITQGKLAQAMLSRRPVCKFATISDMCYAVLSAENHWDIWAEMARLWKDNNSSKWPDQNSSLLKGKLKSYGSLSQPVAQQRFVEVQNAIHSLFAQEDRKAKFSEMFADYYRANRGLGRKRKRAQSPEQLPSQPIYETDFLAGDSF